MKRKTTIIIIEEEQEALPLTWTTTDVLLPYKEYCMFDNWDWEKNPFAMMYCPCRKCNPQYATTTNTTI